MINLIITYPISSVDLEHDFLNESIILNSSIENSLTPQTY